MKYFEKIEKSWMASRVFLPSFHWGSNPKFDNLFSHLNRIVTFVGYGILANSEKHGTTLLIRSSTTLT
jgi:hypothetical protein